MLNAYRGCCLSRSTISQPNNDKFARYTLALLLILAFSCGGTARDDVASLVVLRAVSLVVLFIGLFRLSAMDYRSNRFLLLSGGSIFLLIVCQLMPLPPILWQALPDRVLVRQIDEVIEAERVWRPMTMASAATYNGLWSVVPPLACLVLAVQLRVSALASFVYLLFAIGLLTTTWALLQMAGEPGSALYLYDVTNRHLPVGIFANRNHQAAFLACVIPMLAYIVEQHRSQWAGNASGFLSRFAAIILGAFIATSILVTGSRAGLLVGLFSIASVFLFKQGRIERSGRRTSPNVAKQRAVLAFGLVGSIAILSFAVYAGRDMALQRLVHTDESTELRARIMPTVMGMVENYLPWGTGQGSFESVYLIHEPDGLLSPVYMNHVHNDWIEIVLEGGLPVVVIASSCLLWLMHAVTVASSKGREDPCSRNLGRLGLILILLLGLASVTDYPLRVPALACLASLAFVWISKMKAEARIGLPIAHP
ncbi:O-antigen ligase family protein [Sphingobium sp. TKS]|uniref:O-antigen ligase family protein n=2 Tax=Sphingobium TaxID=165695 RepID=UPI00076FE72A|nr:O-antigen ligase family protein [Sphingobium sp. TKS]AMK26088.1 O-antigen polymerase family protein [Sphingobium sp. TKS]